MYHTVDPHNFPDPTYLEALARHLREQFEAHNSTLDRLVTYAGATLKWDGDFLTDPNVRWSKEALDINSITLTGVGPEWNKIIIEQCDRSPEKLRALIQTDAAVAKLAQGVPTDRQPIMVRADGDKLKTLDGMKRVIAAIRDGQDTIAAYVAHLDGKPRPQCEPHVIYDLLRSYERGINTDKDGLITALRYLRRSYANVDMLLRERFNGGWMHDDRTGEVIRQVLEE
jgi:hypothetical protein